MKHLKCAAPHTTLEDVQRAFEKWRRDRKPRTAIPSALWEAAASLCEHHSINEISRALHLNHTDLKKRVEARNTAESQSVEPPTFIEIPVPFPAGGTQCTLEMENRSGETIRVCFTDFRGFDFLALAEAFWSATRS